MSRSMRTTLSNLLQTFVMIMIAVMVHYVSVSNASLETTEHIFANADFGVVIFSKDGRVDYSNDSLESITGMSAEKVVSENLLGLVGTRKIRADGTTDNEVVVPFVPQDGEMIPLAVSLYPTNIPGTKEYIAFVRRLDHLAGAHFHGLNLSQ